MPRISEIATEDLPPQIVDPTWEKVAGHCPEQLIQLDALMRSFSEHSTMPRRYIEIAIVTVSRINECRHCVGRHSTHLYETGLGHETIERILDVAGPDLDETDSLVRDYAIAVTESSGSIRDAMFERLRTRFNEAQIVELTMRIGLATFFNRFNNALQIDLDNAHLEKFQAQDGSAESLPNPR